MDISIRVEGAEELIARLTKLEQMARVKAAIAGQARFLQGKLREYPRKAPMANPLIRTNDKVRRGYFYHLRHGNITVPYQRGGSGSEKLGARWTVETRNTGWTAVVGNNASYAQLVQGPRQTAQHIASGWLNVDTAVSVYSPRIEYEIRNALEQEVANV